MRFLDAEARPVPASASSRPGAYGHPTMAQYLGQRKADRIDGGGIPQWSPGAVLHLGMAKFASRLVAFGRVAVMTRERQVADAMGTPPRARLDVIDLKSNSGLATVRTAIRVLEQQVGPHLPPGKLPVLV